MVYDRRGALLLQKRAAAKDIQPGKWDTSVGGHLAVGESYPSAAVRETREELGLVIGPDDLEPLHEYVGSSEVETEHVRSFRVRSEGPFTAPPEEIEELRFWTPEELRAALGSGVLTPVLEHELALAGITAAPGATCSLGRDYLDPAAGPRVPATPPPRAALHPDTRDLHDAIDAAIRRHRQPYLHPDGETLQLDLFGSEPMVRWQERKAAAMFLSSESWAALPQIYGRYGTENGRGLIAAVCRLEQAAGALLTDGGMQACALASDVLFAPGSHAVVTRSVYNKSKSYLRRLAERQGGEVTLVDDGDPETLERAVRPTTSLLFTETYSNPLTRALDPTRLAALAARARDAGARGAARGGGQHRGHSVGPARTAADGAGNRPGGGQRHQGAGRRGSRHVGLPGGQSARPAERGDGPAGDARRHSGTGAAPVPSSAAWRRRRRASSAAARPPPRWPVSWRPTHGWTR